MKAKFTITIRMDEVPGHWVETESTHVLHMDTGGYGNQDPKFNKLQAAVRKAARDHLKARRLKLLERGPK